MINYSISLKAYLFKCSHKYLLSCNTKYSIKEYHNKKCIL